MLAVAQRHGIADSEGLIVAEGRSQILQAAELGSEVQDGQTPITGRRRYAADSQLPFNIVGVAEIVDRVVVAAVVSETQRVQEEPFDGRVAGVRVVVMNGLPPAEVWERIKLRVAKVVEDE